MNMIQQLQDPAQWQRFCDYKLRGGHLSHDEEAALTAFVQEGHYQASLGIILDGGCFSPPKMAQISKSHSQKKRTVFLFIYLRNSGPHKIYQGYFSVWSLP